MQSESEIDKPPVTNRNCFMCEGAIPEGYPVIYIPLPDDPRIMHMSTQECSRRRKRD
jgi:hypothetical protein